jgi:hypothetical protein
MCLSDLRQAVLSQHDIPGEFLDQQGTRRDTVFSRLYRDRYRPVREGGHDYWCRMESTTGSRIPDVRCELAWVIEDEYATLSNYM